MTTMPERAHRPATHADAPLGAMSACRAPATATTGHRPRWRAPSLLAAIAVLVAAALAAIVMPRSQAAYAGTQGWITTGWNAHLLYQAQPGLASQFFDTPSSYGTGSSAASSPVTDGFTTTPVLVYTSYAQFAADIKAGAISSTYHWVLYDLEDWSLSPLNEQQQPLTYLAKFGKLAHEHGYQVIEAPARDLGNVAGSSCPKQPSETLNAWYVRCGIARAGAAASDVFVVQDQANTVSLPDYTSLFNSALQQARAANPACAVYGEVSTNYGTPDQMAAAAQSVAADGFYVSVTSTTIPQAAQFFQDMG